MIDRRFFLYEICFGINKKGNKPTEPLNCRILSSEEKIREAAKSVFIKKRIFRNYREGYCRGFGDQHRAHQLLLQK